MPHGCTSVCKCMLPKSRSDHRKVDKSWCPCDVVVDGETEKGGEIGRSR